MWIKSSRCDSRDCVEVDRQWRKSRRCDSGSCAEVATDQDGVAIRNNQEPGDVLVFAPADWQTLLDDLRSGRLVRP